MLSIYTLEQAEKWDEVVRSFHDYDAYYLSGYVKAFQIHGDGEPLLIYLKNENTRAINVVMKRDVAKDENFENHLEKNRYFDFSSPYGYGGWLLEGEQRDDFLEEYELWCRENDIISEFIRFHPLLKNHTFAKNNYDIVPLGETVAMDLSSPETIWQNLTSKNRNMVRKAKKNGIRIYNGRCPEFYKIFHDIYDKTMKKDHAEKYYYFEDEFYESVLEDLSKNAEVFYAVFDGKVIASSIMLYANRRMSYHLSGSLIEYANLAPTNLLLYEAALWGCMNGCKTLYLGGGVGSAEDNLFKFKKAFYRGDKLNRFYIGRKIFDEGIYNSLCELKGLKKEEVGYFPAYRSKG